MQEWTEFHDRHQNKIELVPGVDCWIWVGCTHPKGHGRVNSKSGHNYAHRAAYHSVHGSIPEGAMVRHKCGNAACVRPGHLALGTAADNAKDTADMQRCANATPHAAVRGIRKDYDLGMPLSEIAEKYGVAYGSVYPIVCYQNFPHVDPENKGKHKRRTAKALSKETVWKIKDLLDQGHHTQAQISKMFGVNAAAVSNIKTGARYVKFLREREMG